ncbi:hypothetical protein Tco_1357342, partial [Tanacetum coccineum]
RTESETEAAAPKGDKDQGEVDSSTVTLGVSIPISDPEKHMRLWQDQTLSPCKKTRLDQTLENYMCLLLDQTLSTSKNRPRIIRLTRLLVILPDRYPRDSKIFGFGTRR